MRPKVIILFLMAGLIPFAVVGILGDRTANVALQEQAFKQLVSIRESQKKHIEEYFFKLLICFTHVGEWCKIAL